MLNFGCVWSTLIFASLLTRKKKYSKSSLFIDIPILNFATTPQIITSKKERTDIFPSAFLFGKCSGMRIFIARESKKESKRLLCCVGKFSEWGMKNCNEKAFALFFGSRFMIWLLCIKKTTNNIYSIYTKGKHIANIYTLTTKRITKRKQNHYG